MPAAKASKLVRSGGRLVSAKSKTGNPLCSSAMSAWVRSRHGGPAAGPDVFAMLGKCRAMAHQNKKAAAQQASGKLAEGRGTWQRSEAAAKLQASRSSRPSAAKPAATVVKSAAPIHSPSPFTASAAAATAGGGWSLKQDSAHGTKSTTFTNLGPGVTRPMFDMKKGDLPGQTSMFDRKPAAPAPAPVTATVAKASTSKPSGPSPGELARMARLAPRISGGSPAALLAEIDRAQARRAAKAKTIRAQRAKLADSRRDPSTHTDHAPGHVGHLQTDLIHFDPHRFQYKMAAAHDTGSVGSLHGVKQYDQDLGGVLQVWKDPANGKVYVVNGHNRLDLAKKLGAGKVAVRFLGAKTAEDARATGALTNIAEGRGTSIDAAKFFRETGHNAEDVAAKGIPMREKVATEGLALANLHKPIFDRVISGDISPTRAAIVGQVDHATQKAVMANLDKKGKRGVSDDVLRATVEDAKAAPKAVTKSRGLFGDDEDEVSLALHRGAAIHHVSDRLSREKRVFGTVAKSRNAADLERGGNQINTHESGKISQEAAENLGVFRLLKARSGPVSSLLNEAAERVHKGEKASKVHDEVYKRLPAAIRSMLDGTA